MTYPKNERGSQLCLVVGDDGVTVYCNVPALRSMTKWLQWLADSDPAEHYEWHVVWNMLAHYRKRKNVSVLVDRGPQRGKSRKAIQDGFELTFMAVTQREMMLLKRRASAQLGRSDHTVSRKRAVRSGIKRHR